jgi:hypothetical protein
MDDIQESIDFKTRHYLGAFVLSITNAPSVYDIVDGQQRIVTLSLLLAIIIRKLGECPLSEDAKNLYVVEKETGNLRVRFTSKEENDFYTELIGGGKPIGQSSSQIRLAIVHEAMAFRINSLDQETTRVWYSSIDQLEVLEFIKPSEGEAIRIFETVNDRGKPLSVTDKVKSHLVYYSNRYLHGELDRYIYSSFGSIFHCYDSIKDYAKRQDCEIDYIARSDFDEDSVLRHHFVSYSNEQHTTSKDYLDDFLKAELKNAKSDVSRLKNVIENYVSDLCKFTVAYEEMISRVGCDSHYWKVFTQLEPSSRYYPLLVRLKLRNMLEQKLPSDASRSFLHLVESLVFREEKVYGRKAESNPTRLIRLAKYSGIDEMEREIRLACRQYTDEGMKDRLTEGKYNNPRFLNYFFLEYNEYLREKDNRTKYALNELLNLRAKRPTIEHILPQTTDYDVKPYGYKNREDYNQGINAIGNLVLLESSINSKCSNRPPKEKAEIYLDSEFYDPKWMTGALKSAKWNKEAIIVRARALCDFAVMRWAC